MGHEPLCLNTPRQLSRLRQAPILIPVLVGLRLASSASLSTAALVTGHQNYQELSGEIDKDLQTLEASVSYLETSVSSLTEVVLQNPRGLDLLFLKQGSLYVALGEACGFYANHSDIVKDSISKVRQWINNQEQQRREASNWYETLFNGSPWLTTLISALSGPLILLLIFLFVAPCLFECLHALSESASRLYAY